MILSSLDFSCTHEFSVVLPKKNLGEIFVAVKNPPVKNLGHLFLTAKKKKFS